MIKKQNKIVYKGICANSVCLSLFLWEFPKKKKNKLPFVRFLFLVSHQLENFSHFNQGWSISPITKNCSCIHWGGILCCSQTSPPHCQRCPIFIKLPFSFHQIQQHRTHGISDAIFPRKNDIFISQNGTVSGERHLQWHFPTGKLTFSFHKTQLYRTNDISDVIFHQENQKFLIK